ncbi:hypothetical protein DFS34DRAFT_588783 [Phlyctochytrium arcticum]|nr:hypothetical protein DFS34DRAFT_588783 [Phlyctochytrium arcticum]
MSRFSLWYPGVISQDRLAAFGPRLADEGLSGTLMSISSLVPQLDDAGCEPFVGPSEKWIALVQRGRCAFVDKIRAMQASGAHSVVVGDSSPNSGLITMFAAGNTSDVQIPSVFVSWDAFQYLRAETHKKGPRGDIEITLYPNDLDVPITEIIIVTVVSPGAVMLCMYLIWRYRRYRQRQQELAPLNVVHDLPTRVYAAEDDQNRCPICLDAFAEGDVLRVLLCRHEYHVVCVDKWLTQHKRLCPICKQDISPKEALETTPLLSGASGSNDNNV